MARRAGAYGMAMVLASSAACTYDFDEPFSQQVPGSGGATASASGSTSTSTAASAGGGGAGGGPGEQCGNGTDDDEDGLADCADPDCGDFTCVPVAPAGWSGPSAFSLQPNATCPAGATTLAGGTAPIDAPATCSACACGAPTGGTCGLPSLTAFDGTGCSGATDDQFSPAQPNMCDTFHVGYSSSGVQADPVPLDSAPTCAPSGGGVLAADPATFAANAVLCVTPAAGGCEAGKTCIAKPGPDFVPDPCLHQLGDAQCPPGFGQRTLYFQGKEDTRTCSDCGCDPADDATCTGKTDLYVGSGCSNGPDATVLHESGSCEIFQTGGATNSYIYVPDPGPQGGTCAPTGGALGGSVSGTDPITVCCPG